MRPVLCYSKQKGGVIVKQVIVEADDFGLTPAIAKTILALLDQGVVTATNCMPTMPGFQDSMQLAEAAGRTQMGIHLIIDRHLPACSPEQIASLVDERGYLLAFDQFTARLAIGEINLGELASELRQQIKLAQRFGVTIDHITTHKNFELLSPAVFDVVSQLAQETGLPLRHNLVAGEQPKLWGMLKTRSITAPTQTLGLRHTADDLKTVAAAIKALPEAGTLALITHPGTPSSLLAQRSSLNEDRSLDREWLVGPWQAYLAAHTDVKISGYQRL